jgi:hypothetical protein
MAPWSDDPKGLFLFTVEEFTRLPDGTELTCIDGSIAIKGKDSIDQDVRFGHMAYGINDPWNHPLKHLCLIFKLSQ